MRTTNYTEGHYVYTHAGPDGIFYVGKGKGRRGHLLLCRAPWHQSRIDAIGRENVVVTVYPAETDAAARNLETAMISRLHAEGEPLCNIEGIISRSKPNPTAGATKPRSVRLNAADWKKLKRLGSDWLAKEIDRAKEKP